MSVKPFLEYVDIMGSSVSYFEGSRLYLSTGALKGDLIAHDELEKVTYESKPSRANLNVADGDIIFAKMQGTIKVLKITPETQRLIASTGFFAVHPKDGVDSDFIVHTLKSTDFNLQKDKLCSGATQKALTISGLQKINIADVSSTAQRRIGKILNLVSAEVAARREQIAVLDKLAKDLFVDMFGDLKANPKHWLIVDVESVCSVIVDCPHSTPQYVADNTGYYCIKTGDLRGHVINWDMAEFLSESNFNERVRRYTPKYEDIVYSREGAIFGIAAMIDRKCNVALGQRMMLFSINRDVCDPYFFLYQMNDDVILSQAKENVLGSASPHVNIGNIKKFNFARPPIEVQRTFAERVKKIDIQKSRLIASLEELKTLYKSLTQRAFAGELFGEE